MKKTIGILLDHETFMGIPGNKTGHEKLHLYDKAALQLNLKPFYMSLGRIGKRTATGYTFRSGKYRIVKRSIPQVIHNRAIVLVPYWEKKLRKLEKSSIVFNGKNRFLKFHIFRLLVKQSSLRSYLPATMKYSKTNLNNAMKEYSGLYLKPTNGSVGTGIIKISRRADERWDIHWKKGRPLKKTHQKTIEFINQNIDRQTYLIQEEIPLAKYHGRPYDIRVSVQRDGSGEWQVTGMVGKVAAAGQHVTNVSKGGKVKRCRELFQASGLSYESTKRALNQASLEISKYLGDKIPYLADLGLDMGVTTRGEIKFIEMNGRDQRYSFKKAGMDSTFFRTYLMPLQYAKSLIDKKSI